MIPFRRLTSTCALLTLLACHEQPLPVRLGLLVDDAPMPPLGDGIRLAVALRNAEGGVLVGGVRRRIELVERPIVSAAEGADRFAELANNPATFAVIAPIRSDHAGSAAAAAERIHVPLICVGATNVRLTAGRQWVFRTTFNDRDQTTLLARYATDSLLATHALVVIDTTSGYTRDLGALFANAFEAAGRTNAKMLRVGRGPLDVTMLETVRRESLVPHTVIMIALYPPALTETARRLRERGVTTPLIAPDAWPSPPPSPFGQGVYFVRTQLRDTRALAALRDYLVKTPSKRLPPGNLLSFDAASALLDAVERTEHATPAEVQAALRAGPPQTSASAVLDYRSSGDPDASFAVVTQTATGFRVLWTTSSHRLDARGSALP